MWYVVAFVPKTDYSSMLQGEENKGMAMTFTLVSHLREKLSGLVDNRVKARIAEEREKERLAIEVRTLLDSMVQEYLLMDQHVRRRRRALAEPQSRLSLSRSGRPTLTRRCHREKYGMKKRSYVPSLPKRGKRSRRSELV